jgi:penicillin-binding protein 2
MLGEETLAWFAAYAPFDKPEIAIAVVVEKGTTGGRDAAPIAKAAFAEYFGIDLNSHTNTTNNSTDL